LIEATAIGRRFGYARELAARGIAYDSFLTRSLHRTGDSVDEAWTRNSNLLWMFGPAELTPR
jgi:hypothetical protein